MLDTGRPALTEHEIIAAVQRSKAAALVCMLADPISAKVLGACRSLRVVAQNAVGVDNIDVDAARRLGVVVCHTPGALTDATANHTLAMLLAACRSIVPAHRLVSRRQWTRFETMMMLGPSLAHSRLGIIGCGRIGQAVARRAAAFGIELVYHQRRRLAAHQEAALGLRSVATLCSATGVCC